MTEKDVLSLPKRSPCAESNPLPLLPAGGPPQRAAPLRAAHRADYIAAGLSRRRNPHPGRML